MSLTLALLGAHKGQTVTLDGVAFVDGFSDSLSEGAATDAFFALRRSGVDAVRFDPSNETALEHVAALLQASPAPAPDAGSTPPQLEAQVGQVERDGAAPDEDDDA